MRHRVLCLRNMAAPSTTIGVLPASMLRISQDPDLVKRASTPWVANRKCRCLDKIVNKERPHRIMIIRILVTLALTLRSLIKCITIWTDRVPVLGHKPSSRMDQARASFIRSRRDKVTEDTIWILAHWKISNTWRSKRLSNSCQPIWRLCNLRRIMISHRLKSGPSTPTTCLLQSRTSN